MMATDAAPTANPVVSPSTAVSRSCDVVNRVRIARDRALEHLLDARTDEGIWRERFDLSAMTGAAYVVALRTTGLIEEPGSADDEVRVIRHMIHQRNDDGGFEKYPQSGSSADVTRVALTALRLSLGEVAPAGRPWQRFRVNPLLTGEMIDEIRRVVAEGEWYLRDSASSARLHYRADVAIFCDLLRAVADPARVSPARLPMSCFFVALANRLNVLMWAQRQMSTLAHRIVPAMAILQRAARVQWRRVHGSLVGVGGTGDPEGSSRWTRELAGLIAKLQNPGGDWFYCAPYTLLNVMALTSAGFPLDDPHVVRAHRFLRRSLYPTGDEGFAVSLMNCDVWDTSAAVVTLLSRKRAAASDGPVARAIEFLMESQTNEGGFGWGHRSLNDCDVDSTSAVLRVMAIAEGSAFPERRRRIRGAIERARSYIESRQSRHGGFSVWVPTVVPARPGPVGPVLGGLVDVPSADLTARVVAALLHSGSTIRDQTIRRGFRFIARMQSPHGGWWCRWWAGYVSGTTFVLDAFSAAGLRWGGAPTGCGRFVRRLQASMERGVRFLVEHQNLDGGWGETKRADTDSAWAGRGPSRPMQTAVSLNSLVACGYPVSTREVRMGISWLLDAADNAGRWHDHQVTYTMIPGSLYYPHPLYTRTVLPAALSAFLNAHDDSAGNGLDRFPHS